jgi:hypothetical protein
MSLLYQFAQISEKKAQYAPEIKTYRLRKKKIKNCNKLNHLYFNTKFAKLFCLKKKQKPVNRVNELHIKKLIP